MPVYFAYGANMDRAAMRERCPASRPLGPARLMNHRFFIMRQGTGSVRRAAGAVVHGVLWELALADVRALDRFEEVASGLYGKAVIPVLKTGGGARAIVYIGSSLEDGAAQPGYLEIVIAAAREAGLPNSYLRTLSALLPPRTRAGHDAPPAWPPHPPSGVRPRFATPFDRD